MTTATLTAKLSKMNVVYSIFDYNGFNKNVCFSINGMNFEAAFSEGNNIITSFCQILGYDDALQETSRIFFDNFAQLMRHAN